MIEWLSKVLNRPSAEWHVDLSRLFKGVFSVALTAKLLISFLTKPFALAKVSLILSNIQKRGV